MKPHRLLRYFKYAHLPEHMQAFSKPFSDLAHQIDASDAVDGAEKTVALRKILEAKDCFVRAHIPEA